MTGPTVSDMPTDEPTRPVPSEPAGVDTAQTLGLVLVAAVGALVALRMSLGQRAQPGHVHAGTVDAAAHAAMWVLVAAAVKLVAFTWPDTAVGKAFALIG